MALTLVTAACGGDDDSADTPEATSAPEATTAPTEPAPETTIADDMAVPEGWPDQIVFGFVPSQEQEKLQDDIQPFIEVLEAGLGIKVDGRVTTDYTGLVTAMGSGQADVGAFGPFGYVLGKDNFGNIEALIQSVRYGSATYHGQWITNDPSICAEPPVAGTALENVDGEIVQVDALEAIALQVGVDFDADGNKVFGATTEDGDVISPGSSCIGNLEDVAGKTVAFTTQTSTSGYLFPALQLTELGIDPQNDVTPVFTGGHDGAVTAVYNDDAQVGLSFDDARSTIDETNPDVGEKVIVFSITDEIPNDVVAVRSDLPDDLKQAIYDTISAYLATEEGEAVFEEIYEWTDIRPAEESDFDVVRDAANALGITEPID
jgi:phosphonate transport system substrate-binding protein